jgi:RHH-type proline utilization regulon transcriptional repressor/proline dehydrogenase/delta 1-pyrroline-5-carboxylate dehydrogenase
VKPGSFFHLTEVFGPVLGLMRAETLEEAIELQNQTDFGLTGGIHSLDAAEVRQWADEVRVGNAYVNRGITGAIVQRQSFGGWKKSSVGLGSKAGGPNYVMLMGSWSDAVTKPVEIGVTTGSGEVDAFLGALSHGEHALPAEDLAWLTTAAVDDAAAWSAEFGTPRDLTGLESEANIFRYRPAQVVLRVSADAVPREGGPGARRRPPCGRLGAGHRRSRRVRDRHRGARRRRWAGLPGQHPRRRDLRRAARPRRPRRRRLRPGPLRRLRAGRDP